MGDSGGLNNDADDEDCSVDEDSVFPGYNLGEETAVESANPCSQFKDGSQPAELRLIRSPDALGTPH